MRSGVCLTGGTLLLLSPSMVLLEGGPAEQGGKRASAHLCAGAQGSSPGLGLLLAGFVT